MPSRLGKKLLVDMSIFKGLAEKNVLFGMFSLQDFHFLQEKHLNEIIWDGHFEIWAILEKHAQFWCMRQL